MGDVLRKIVYGTYHSKVELKLKMFQILEQSFQFTEERTDWETFFNNGILRYQYIESNILI